MALNTNAPYTGAVEYFMQYDAPSTYTAPGIVVGGQYKIDNNIRWSRGVAGQSVPRAGIARARCSAVLVEPLKALMSGMVRATPASTVTAKSFSFGNQDGEWTYTDCQPGGFIAQCEVAKPFTVQADLWAKTPAQTETGDSQEAVSGGITDKWSDFDVLIDAADYGVQSFKLALLTNPFLYSTLDARSADSKRLPVEVLLGVQDVILELECAKQISAAGSSIIADDIDEDIDIVIAGTGVTFTMSGLATPREIGPYENEQKLLVWKYKFGGTNLTVS